MKRTLAALFLILLSGGAAAQESTIFPVSIETDLINPDIHPDETQNYYILITPTLGRVENVKLSVFGKIARFISLEKISVSLDYGETQQVGIEVNAAGAQAGTYSGVLILDVNDRTKEIPIKITVIEKESGLDMALEVKTKEVKSPGPIKFVVTIYNVGRKDRFDLHLHHKLKSVADETLSEREEDVTLVTSLSLERSFFSEGLSLEKGTYYIETTAHYEDNSATSVDSFRFVEPFWTTTKMAVAFFVIIVAAFAAGFRFYR